MHLPHFAKRPVATFATLSFVLAACGDSTAPDAPFDAAGMSADVQASNAVFTAPAIVSYNAFSAEIDDVVSGAVGASMAIVPATALSTRERVAHYARQLTARFSRSAGVRPNFATSGIPAEYAGKTFEYDAGTGDYVIGADREGVPADGVWFILYAVNPITGQPTEPLTEIGHAELTSSFDDNSGSVSAKVVSDGVVYFDYTASVLAGQSSLSLSIEGSASDGTNSAEFKFSILSTDDGGTINYLLKVPTRGFQITMQLAASSSAATMKFELRGEHGRVTITGTPGETSDIYQVRVNGDLFAKITVTETTVTVVDADGGPLSEEEQETLDNLMAVFLEGWEFFLTDLVVPPVVT